MRVVLNRLKILKGGYKIVRRIKTKNTIAKNKTNDDQQTKTKDKSPTKTGDELSYMCFKRM